MTLTTLLCFLAVGFQGPPSQEPTENLGEIRETIRFIRLAESRKQLDFSDEKLLAVNAILDDYEAKKFELKQDEMQLQRKVRFKDFGDRGAAGVLDDFLANKRSVMDLDLQLFEDIRKALSPEEAIQFFTFYEAFQREVQRRVRTLMRERGAKRRGGFRQKP